MSGGSGGYGARGIGVPIGAGSAPFSGSQFSTQDFTTNAAITTDEGGSRADGGSGDRGLQDGTPPEQDLASFSSSSAAAGGAAAAAAVADELLSMATLKPFRYFVDQAMVKWPVNSVAFHGAGEHFVTAGDDGFLGLFDAVGGRKLALMATEAGCRAVQFTHARDAILYANSSVPSVNYVSLRTQQCICSFAGGGANSSLALSSVAMSPHDDTFMTGSADGVVRLWDLRQPRKCLKQVGGWMGWVGWCTQVGVRGRSCRWRGVRAREGTVEGLPLLVRLGMGMGRAYPGFRALRPSNSATASRLGCRSHASPR
jgi:hypothetical protein